MAGSDGGKIVLFPRLPTHSPEDGATTEDLLLLLVKGLADQLAEVGERVGKLEEAKEEEQE